MLQVATRSSHGLEADVWGLGCLLYTLLVGQPPFDTDAVKSTLTKVVMADYKVRVIGQPIHGQLFMQMFKLLFPSDNLVFNDCHSERFRLDLS